MGSTSQTSNAQRTSRIPGFSVTHVQSSELAGLLIGIAGLLTLLSLISYTPYDPSFNTAAPAGADTRNWIGVAGAFFADALVQLFGWTAFFDSGGSGGNRYPADFGTSDWHAGHEGDWSLPAVGFDDLSAGPFPLHHR